MAVRLRVPRSVDDAGLRQYLLGKLSLSRIKTMAESSIEGIHLVLPSCSPVAALAHLEQALPSFVIHPVSSTEETTFHIFLKHHFLCEQRTPNALIRSATFARLIEKYLRTFGQGLYIRDQIEEEDWRRHLSKCGGRLTKELTNRGGRLTLTDVHRMICGACGELLLEVGMQFFKEATRREGVQGFQLLHDMEGERIDASSPRQGVHMRADSWLQFASTYNCELWVRRGDSAQLLAEIDIIATVRHGGQQTFYLLDATTSNRVPTAKLYKHRLFAEHLEPSPFRSLETIVVSFVEERIAVRPSEPNLRVLTLPLREVVAQLQDITLDALLRQSEFQQVSKQLSEQMR